MQPLDRWDWRQMIAWALTDVDALREEFVACVRLIEAYHS